MRYLVTIAILILGSLAALAQPAAASCIQQDLPAQIARADVIAAGRITSIGSSGGPLVFQPVTIYKGTLEGGPVTVATGPGGGGGVTSVDYRAAVGDQVLYLMGKGRSFSTNDCSGSHAGPPTAEEVRLLGAGAAPPAGGGLIGEIGIFFVAALLAGATVFYLRRREAARKMTSR